MSSKARKTGDSWEEQDALSRAYKSEDEPTRTQERLADVWVQSGDLSRSSGQPVEAGRITPLLKHVKQTKPFTRLTDLKEKAKK